MNRETEFLMNRFLMNMLQSGSVTKKLGFSIERDFSDKRQAKIGMVESSHRSTDLVQ